jgi:hypothetical protein
MVSVRGGVGSQRSVATEYPVESNEIGSNEAVESKRRI